MNQKPYAENYIPLTECEVRVVYKVVSRNLTYAVYNGKNGFIGIREKFGARYLFKEYHWDAGPPYGTVCPQEVIEQLPNDIEIMEYLPATDAITGRLVAFDVPIDYGGIGWYFTDTGEASTEIRAENHPYEPLFKYLDNIQNSAKEKI